jgi:hypothetical protein
MSDGICGNFEKRVLPFILFTLSFILTFSSFILLNITSAQILNL